MNADDKLALDAALFITFNAIDETEEVLRLFSATKSESLNQIAKLTHEDIEPSAIKIHKTLNNKIVRSGQEFKICNWLILHDINYEYEKHLDIKEISDYHPDFYYPDSDCWHEHFGINKYGKAPMHFSLNRPLSYEEMVRRKRKFLNQNKIRWFETTSADFYDDSWYASLDRSLKEFGEKPQFIGWERYRTKVHKFNKDNKEEDDGLYSELPLINLISIAIKHFKNNQLTFDDIDNKISSTKNKLRCISFLKIFKAIFTEYQNELKADNSIDFEDMISESTRLIDLNKVKHQFKVILVDEFQDMSNSRSRLIQSLKKQNIETIFFAVGDDWQSIYRFAGSDISNMVNFESKFGFTSINKLNMTFRFNQGIADVSSEFIQKNPLQIKKSVTSINLGRKNKIRKIFHSPVSEFDPNTKRWIKTPESFNRELLNQLNIVEAYAASKGTKVSVAFIARYHFLKPDHFDDLSKTFKKYLNIIFTTMHSSKGLGFDFVFIFGMNSAFPSKRTDDEIITMFMPEPDNFEFCEERRLFYVALTRAKKAVMLFIDDGKPSPFILELSSSKYLDVIH
jgi:DNA helicase-4